nr:hypothetical protein [Tanacetum cinerariifolium]
MYNSWASRIRIFIKGKKHGRMMLDSYDNGVLVYPTIEENGQTRPKKYSELTEAQQLQDDCDLQVTSIILHDLLLDVHPFKIEESRFNKFKEDKLKVLLAVEIEELLQPQRETMQLVNHDFYTEDLEAYDSNCNDLSSAKTVLMDVQEMPYSEQTHIVDFLDNKISSDSNIISYYEYLQESQDAEQMTDHLANLDKENQTNKMVNESLTTELERYKDRVTLFEQRHNVDLNERENLIDSQMDDLIWNRNAKLEAFQQEIDALNQTLSTHFHLKKAQRIKPTLYDGSVIAKKQDVIYVMDDEETLILKEESRLKDDSHTIQDSNKPLLHSTRVICSTNASKSKPSGNTKNNRISQSSSSNKPNKVEDQSRSVKSRKNKNNALVKHSVRNAKLESMCAICNKCLFDANHDMPLIDYVNVHSKSKSTRNKKKKVWKPTGKVFIEIVYYWKPTGRAFTIVGNRCHLTKTTSTKLVHAKETTNKSVITPTQGILVYSRKPKASRSLGSSSKVKIVESKISKTKEPNQSWGSIVSDVPSSSLNDCRLSQLFCALSEPCGKVSHHTAHQLDLPREPYVRTGLEKEMTDYALWEVKENGATLPKTKVVEGVTIEMPIKLRKKRLRED